MDVAQSCYNWMVIACKLKRIFSSIENRTTMFSNPYRPMKHNGLAGLFKVIFLVKAGIRLLFWLMTCNALAPLWCRNELSSRAKCLIQKCVFGDRNKENLIDQVDNLGSSSFS